MEESAPRSLEDTQAWQSGTQNMEWNTVSSTSAGWGVGGWRKSTFAKIDLISVKINQVTRGDGQVISDFSERESGFGIYNIVKCYPECPQMSATVLQLFK